jgi:transposase, IS5 family
MQRNIERQLPAQPEAVVKSDFEEPLAKTWRIRSQQRQDKDKLYSFHAPRSRVCQYPQGIEGKTHKKYKFGV